MEHRLRTLGKFFNAVCDCDGKKTFEVRKDDRNFQVGDTLILEKYEFGEFQNDTCEVEVTYILGREPDEKQYVPEGYVILGIK